MRNPTNFSPLLVPRAEAFAAIGVGTTKGYELVNEGKLVARKLGSRTMITAASLHQFVESLPAFSTKSA